MSNYLNTENCKINEPRETVKMVLNNTDEILKETRMNLENVFESISGERGDVAKTPCADQDNGDISMMDTLRRQRATAERILKIAIEIREALW